MANQKGLYKIQGTLGDLTFLKSREGYKVREKSTLSAERIRTDASFQRTREINSEFSQAAKSGKLLRDSVKDVLQLAKGERVVSRLVAGMFDVLHSDGTSARGLRNVGSGDATRLEGFDFNDKAKLGSIISATYKTRIDRLSGALIVDIDPFVAANAIEAPQGASHFRVVSKGVELDFASGKFIADRSDSPILPVDQTPVAAISLVNSVTPNSTVPLLLIMGIQFYEQTNNIYYPLKNAIFNALKIVSVG